MRRLVKGVYWWPMGITVTAATIALCGLAQLITIARGLPRDGRLVHPFARRWGRLLFHLTPGWRIEVVGGDNLPKAGGKPAVLVSNHESLTDIFAMYFLDTQFRWLSKEEAFRIPFVGQAMGWCDYVPVLRGNKDSHALALEASADRLRKGFSMFFFPEGTRSDDGSIRPFKTGAFKLARDEQVPVIPVIIQGARDLMPKGVMAPGKARVTLQVLTPMPPPPVDAGPQALADYAETVRARIVAEHARIVQAKAALPGESR